MKSKHLVTRSALFITKYFSPRSIITFLLFILALNMIFPAKDRVPILASRVADEIHVNLSVLGLFILTGAFITYSNLYHMKARLIGQIPYWIFLVGCLYVTWKYNLAWQGVIIYTGYALILGYVQASDYIRSLDEVPD